MTPTPQSALAAADATSSSALPPTASRYAALGQPFHQPVQPTPLPEPALLHFNTAVADTLGLADVGALLGPLSGNAPWPGYAPLASVYAGHQFGVFVPQLGDGRALMIAELHDREGRRQELQLKGAGRTPYSRGADGRAVLRSSIREYLCSEAMHAVGIATTRCLSLVGSPQPVVRETMETAAVVCRVAPSFVRFGHFEFFYHRGLHEHLPALADHVIAEHFPHLLEIAEPTQRYAAWLREVVARTALMAAQWQGVGFCHGVMNTDNFSILGLTIDYGPFGFLDAFQWDHICNHSDDGGRYAYGRQPQIAHWNCGRLLQAAVPLLGEDMDAAVELARDIYHGYGPAFSDTAARLWADKLGLKDIREGDAELMERLLALMHDSHCDFTNSFRKLAQIPSTAPSGDTGLRNDVLDIAAWDAWVADYQARLQSEGNTDDAARAAAMNRVNPKYVLRNHLAQAAIAKAEAGDMGEIDVLMKLLSRPYDEQPDMAAYAAPPPEEMRHIEVSCSS
ncbi:MAG: YdiU family protein [Rhodocyclaceae bacterium]|nr:MAG: YdiU family protein [Rhodocyclaceae bacterium]